MTPTRFAPARRQLEAYEESWKQEHETAQLGQDAEDVLAAGLMVLQLLQRAEDSWRERVFRGITDYHPEEEAVLLRCYRDWLTVTESVLQSLRAVEQRLPAVENGEEARQQVAKVRDILANWHPPALSKAIGLRESQLSPEAARDLREILARPAPTGALRPVRRLPAGDPSLLKKRSS